MQGAQDLRIKKIICQKWSLIKFPDDGDTLIVSLKKINPLPEKIRKTTEDQCTV